MPAFGPPVRFRDQRKIYPLWCTLAAHTYWRTAYVYPPDWQRNRPCRKCAHIEPPA